MTDIQNQIINASIEGITLINGYAGVGKSTVLLKRFEQLVNRYSIEEQEIIIVVKDSLKKAVLEKCAEDLSLECNVNISTIYEVISAYLHFIDLDLFNNTIDEEQKDVLISTIYKESNSDFKTSISVDFVVNEINYIQQTILEESKDTLQNLLKKEFQRYALTSRKSSSKNVLTYKEKSFIWGIYEKFLNIVLDDNLFDEHTFFQSFLRLMSLQKNDEHLLSFRHFLIDDIQDFTPVQLSIIYKFLNQDEHSHHLMMTYDPLKSPYKIRKIDNKLIKYISNEVILSDNFRSNTAIFNLLKSSIERNPLYPDQLNYNTSSNERLNYPVVSFFHKEDVEKGSKQFDVVLERLDLFIKTFNYRLNDILLVLCDPNKMEFYKSEFLSRKINVISIDERIINSDLEGITLASKDSLRCVEFPIVFIMDMNDQLLCQSPVNRVTNISKNTADSRLFYKMISIAKDHLILNSCKSNPSYLLLPGSIDYNHLRFEVGSDFKLNTNYNIYRKSEIKTWIKEQLINNYNYKQDSFKSSDIHDLILTSDDDKKIGITLLDDKTNLEVKETFKANNFDYLMYIDEFHYMVYKFENSKLSRIKDIPVNP
ncbi:ATP-dependent nuclease subunit A protein [Haloplasma contractile SSD-17B]|uniref:ATP-dependent nuclease subunit A protein n=1 Tax=Haloplasma contractile SSD-17B TaxID=1033810 RepID=U2EFP7_9MOLU|nr:ATP-dependent nuclease subunit A protein [Haloplasma contractile SSD-17B]